MMLEKLWAMRRILHRSNPVSDKALAGEALKIIGSGEARFDEIYRELQQKFNCPLPLGYVMVLLDKLEEERSWLKQTEIPAPLGARYPVTKKYALTADGQFALRRVFAHEFNSKLQGP